MTSGQRGMLFGVFDGHRGSQVAQFAKNNFEEMFINSDEFKNGLFEKALE